MIIVKKFTTETSHRVLSCTSKKCNSLHGHSYTIEIALEGSPINQANMVLDFSAMKETIKPFVESFDHCQIFSSYDKPEYIKFMKETCNRWIEAPFNLSCEMMALMIFRYSEMLLNRTNFTNGENPKVHSVTVHETATGRCTVFAEDVKKYFKDEWMNRVSFSDDVMNDWPNHLKNIISDPDYKYDSVKVDEQIHFDWIDDLQQ